MPLITSMMQGKYKLILSCQMICLLGESNNIAYEDNRKERHAMRERGNINFTLNLNY